MLISHEWLRTLVPIEVGPEETAGALTARGLTVDALVRRGADAVLDIDVPANRPDCLGHLGVAREIAASFGLALHPSPAPPDEGGPADAVPVSIDEPDLCPRYTARLIRGVRVGPSPPWVVERLDRCGLRAVNNVVDASNLVLLETGHPIHCFDLGRIGGARIRVRRARPGEKLRTLDGVERVLDPDVLVIADADRAVAIAGVIGGEESRVVEATRDVLVEAAWFAPRSVRATARRLGLTTDASQRFERGVDPEGVARAQSLAGRVVAEIAGGSPEPRWLDAYPGPSPVRTIDVRLDRAARLLGYDPAPGEAVRALAALGLRPTERSAGVLRVVPPSWRVDLEREADVIEEIGRHLGYDRIPERAAARASAPSDAEDDPEERSRDWLSHRGFLEAFSYAMIGRDEDDPFVLPGSGPAISLSNPIAEGLVALRRSVLPGLLRSADTNLRRGVRDVRLFEAGRVFLARRGREFPDERRRVGFVWAGAASPRHWSERAREADPLDASGLTEGLLRHLRGDGELRPAPSGIPGLHPGRSTTWNGPDGAVLAWCGELHPEMVAGLDLPGPVQLGEVDLDAAAPRSHAAPRYRAIPRVPSVTRDLSLVIPPGLPFGRVVARLEAIDAPAPASFEILDRYEGTPLEPGEVSVTVRVILQPFDRTLTDREIEAFRSRLVEALEHELGVRIRA